MSKHHFYVKVVKRMLDVIFGVLLLLILSPFLAIFALLIILDSRGKIFFVQPRLGRNGKVFNVYKFRTMTDVPRHEHHEIKGNEEELTRIGKFLRRFKIDEIPQLWNILRGEMSFIGPRPALPEQIKEYDDFSRQRLLVLPGATGLAQVHGNIHLTWQQRWQYDVQYVHNVSFCLDAWIFFRSIGVILAGEKRFLNRRMKNMKKKIPENPRIVLAGAVSSTRCILKSLTRNQMNVVGVFGLAEEASAGVSGYTRLDDLAIRNKIPYHDFRNLNHTETIQKIQQCQPDLLFAVGISQLLHPELLAVPTVGCVGFHPTRLPVGRGRAPIAWDHPRQCAGGGFILSDGRGGRCRRSSGAGAFRGKEG